MSVPAGHMVFFLLQVPVGMKVLFEERAGRFVGQWFFRSIKGL